MELANRILERLLRGGERSAVRGGAGPRPEDLTRADHLYWKLPLDQRDAFHARMKKARDAGAVSLTWSKFGGDDRPLERVRLNDAVALARFLGQTTHEERAAQAETVLAPWRVRVPVLERILDAWRSLKSVRGYGPDSAPTFAAAASVIAHMETATDEGIVRVVSRELFRDSKRIEALVPHLAVLTGETLNDPPRHAEEILAELGLRKEPVPFFLSGAGQVLLAESGPHEVVYPYLAVSPAHVTGFRGRIDWILTIENLTTFHQAAHMRPERSKGLVLYTGGMPSPSWRRALRAVVDSLPEAKVLHFGDIDRGGFRIAACLAQCIAPRPLLPWLMDPSKFSCDRTDVKDREAMVVAARRAGWNDLADTIAATVPGTLEQEDIPVILPKLATGTDTP